MQENKINSFNIEPLVIEIENVIKKGLKTILKDYVDRYELLEKTHNQIMNLPSVRNELNKHNCEESDSDSEDEKTISVSIKDMTQNLIRDEIEVVENRLDKMEKKFDSIVPILDKLLRKIENINNDVKDLKNNNSENETTECKTVYMTPSIIQPSIVSACENENIKFEIKENESEADIESGNEEELLSEELEEENIDSDGEDDVNPLLITCSKLELKSETIDEEEPQSAEKVEEDEELSVGEELGEHESEVVEESVEEVEEESLEEEQVEESDANIVDNDDVETEASEEEEEEVETIPVKEEQEDEEEAELEIITIDDVDYCTNDEENGFIYELSEEGEQGDKVGYLKDGEPFFYADEN
jgi:hypothetical protein